MEYAASGEVASAGTVHYDNVAASLFGDFVVVTDVGPYCWSFPVPEELTLVVAIPKIKVPKQKTKASRGVLPKNVKFSDAMSNMARCCINDCKFSSRKDAYQFYKWISSDIIVTPARKKMIPGFDKVQGWVESVQHMKGAPRSVTISGAGPSVIAFCDLETKKKLEKQ